MTTMTKGVDAGSVLGTTQDTNPNRPATANDVAILIRAYKTLTAARKADKEASRNLEQSLAVYTEGVDYASLQADAELARQVYTQTLVEQRVVIHNLPKGVTGPGGASTRQTMILEFYGQVNRDLKARVSPADAKRINKASFGE